MSAVDLYLLKPTGLSSIPHPVNISFKNCYHVFSIGKISKRSKNFDSQTKSTGEF